MAGVLLLAGDVRKVWALWLQLREFPCLAQTWRWMHICPAPSQAVEAKEGLEVKETNVTTATITFQLFFPQYEWLSGMTVRFHVRDVQDVSCICM